MGLEIVYTKLSDSLPKSNYTFILFLRVRLSPVNVFLIWWLYVILFNLPAKSEVSSSRVKLSFLMILFLIRWKAVYHRRRHAFNSDRFPTLWKTNFFCLCTSTYTSAFPTFLLGRLHNADLFILCLECFYWLNLLSSLFDRWTSSNTLLFAQIKTVGFLLGLRCAEHMSLISIPCRLSIDHLWKNISRIAHAWTCLRPSTGTSSLSIALRPASF